MEIFSDQEKGLQIQHYKSYSWAPLSEMADKGMNPLYYNELNDKRIKDAVNKEMSLQNMTILGAGAQLEIHYHIIVEDKIGSYTESYGNQQHAIANPTRITNYQYRQGTLIIDLMDAKTNSLVWRGWATDVVSNAVKKDPAAAINKAVSKIFKKFPKEAK